MVDTRRWLRDDGAYLGVQAVVLTETPMIKPVVTGQAPVTLERKNTLEEKTETKTIVVPGYTYIS